MYAYRDTKAGHVAPAEKLPQPQALGGCLYTCGPSLEHFRVNPTQLAFDDVTACESDVDEADGGRCCRFAEGKEPVLTFTRPRLPVSRQERLQYSCHLRSRARLLARGRPPPLCMDGQPQVEFAINRLQVVRSLRPAAAVLEPGSRHPIARELERVLISRRSLEDEYVPPFEGILQGPEHLTTPLLQQLVAMAVATGRQPVQ